MSDRLHASGQFYLNMVERRRAYSPPRYHLIPDKFTVVLKAPAPF